MRNAEGSSYQHLRVVSKNSVRIVVGNFATVVDRPQGLTYRIDFETHIAEVRPVAADDAFLQLKDPPTKEQFAALHAADEFVGTSSFEGFDCEIYKIHIKAKKGKPDGLACYAPALNFFAVRVEKRPADDTPSDTYFTDIQIGRTSSPKYFQIPEGFKVIRKKK